MRFLQIEKKLCKKIEKTFKYVLTSWIPYDIILIVELRNRQKSNKCECAGIGRQARLRGVCFTTYGFKSRHSHHRKDLIPCVSSLFYFASKRWRDLKATVKKTVRWTVFRESVDDNLAMHEPHWRGWNFDLSQNMSPAPKKNRYFLYRFFFTYANSDW